MSYFYFTEHTRHTCTSTRIWPFQQLTAPTIDTYSLKPKKKGRIKNKNHSGRTCMYHKSSTTYSIKTIIFEEEKIRIAILDFLFSPFLSNNNNVKKIFINHFSFNSMNLFFRWQSMHFRIYWFFGNMIIYSLVVRVFHWRLLCFPIVVNPFMNVVLKLHFIRPIITKLRIRHFNGTYLSVCNASKNKLLDIFEVASHHIYTRFVVHIEYNSMLSIPEWIRTHGPFIFWVHFFRFRADPRGTRML